MQLATNAARASPDSPSVSPEPLWCAQNGEIANRNGPSSTESCHLYTLKEHAGQVPKLLCKAAALPVVDDQVCSLVIRTPSPPTAAAAAAAAQTLLFPSYTPSSSGAALPSPVNAFPPLRTSYLFPFLSFPALWPDPSRFYISTFPPVCSFRLSKQKVQDPFSSISHLG